MSAAEELDSGSRREILAIAEDAVRAAGHVLMEHYGHLARSQIASKQVARDLVTAADLESERVVVARLRAAFPGHAIEAEEEIRDERRGGLRWFLDPLDGTINFVHGLPTFAVSLALYAGSTPEVAIVHAPRLGETFTATRGGGAWLDGRRLAASAARDLGECIVATGFPYRREELAQNNLENFRRFFYDVRGLRRVGAASVDLAYTAAGRYDAYWELHLAPHDVAAGALLVLEAGGIVTDADGAEDWLRGGHIVAAGPGVHPAVLARVRH